MRRSLPWALVLSLLAGPLTAQPAGAPPAAAPPSVASYSVDATIDRAFALVDRREPARAADALVPIAAREDLTNLQRARTERALGQAYYALGRHADAAAAFARALSAAQAARDREETGWARHWAGTLMYGDGRGDEARALWDAARDDFVAAGDVHGEFEVLDDRANGSSGLERRPFVERCFAIARAQHDPRLEARARTRWAHGLLEAARPGPALVELERAVALLRPLGPAAYGHLADALGALAWALQSHGSNDRALRAQREALRLALTAGDVDAQVWNYFGLGITLVELGRYDEAELAMRQSRTAASRTGSLTTIRVVSESKGWIALKRGNWSLAASELEAAVARPGVELTVMPLVNLADAYRHLGRFDDAVSAASRGVEVARHLGLVDNELGAMTMMAKAQEGRNDLPSAEATLREVIDRLETYRASLAPSDFLKQGFVDRFTDAYSLMVHLLMREDRPRDALAAAERIRARAFADLLVARRARETEEAETGSWLLGAEDDSAAPLTTGVDSPRSVAALDADALVDLARRLDTTLVIYWIHESGSYAWVVGSDGDVHASRVAALPRFSRDVRQAVDVVPDLEFPRSAAPSATPVVRGQNAYKALYAALWAPIEAWLPQQAGARVTIIPHGPLHSLPFAALLDPRGRYVVERYALHYAASGAVLREAAERTGRLPQGDGTDLLVADPQPMPAAESGPPLPALPASRLEVQTISRLLGGPADVLVGRRATEAAVRSALPAAHVVHFATHALIGARDPLGSHLVLGMSTDAHAPPARDGRLTASEIAGMVLSSDLVVLGACRSARGPISSDGIAGLTRSFMAAGAPSVIATLWDIADEPTARLMTRFYREYASGVPKDQALRAAQLALIADLRAGRVKGRMGGAAVIYPEHPWLWAAPILVGAP